MLEVDIRKKLTGFNLDVSFSVGEEILAILGPSGSGKTMTLQCIAGLLKPDEGSIILNGRSLYNSAAKTNLSPQTRRVGFVFQNYALFPHLTVFENISYGIRHLPKSDIETQTNRLLDNMRIGAYRDRYPRQLSAGQQQRVALARAIAPEPEVLLLDEPFSALDSMVKEELQIELLNLQQYYHGSILFVTHNLSEGYRLASKIAIYEAGNIVQCDTKGKLIKSPATTTVAQLTGFKNIFSGTITDIVDNNIYIDFPEFGTFRALLHEGSCLTKGIPVTVGMRSEYIELSKDHDENVLPGTVRGVLDEITATRCIFQAGKEGQVFEALIRQTPLDGISPGTECGFCLPAEYLTVIGQFK